MIRNPGDEGPPPGQGGSGPSDKRASRPMAALRPWMGLGDPRIVRVSRTLGGKDRHSKVCTIRGLRDRRVRLSVPTALQLYGLQDRLGLSQPSKAVDWLLSAAQQEIDKLPPLQFPPGGFIHHPPSMAAHHVAEPHDQPISAHAMATEVDLMKENGCGSLTLLPRDHMGNQTVHKPTQLWSSEYPPRGRWKEHTRGGVDEKDGLLRRLMEQEHPGEDVHNTVVPVHPSLPAIASNNYPYASYYYNLEGSNISCVAHVGGCVMSQAEESHGHRQQQLLWCPSAMLPPMLSPNVAAQLPDHDPKHVNIFHMGSPTS